MSGLPIAIRELADSTLLVQIGAEPIISAPRAAAVTRLTRQLTELQIPGIINLVPAYSTLQIEFDLLATDIPALESAIHAEAAGIEEREATPLRRLTIPVLYGGEGGPDLVEVAERFGLTTERVIELHSGGDYFVAAVGSWPGFGYMLGLPPELAIPRRTTPRVKVPAGSVAIAGNQAGVYPLTTPGGWWLLGKTPARLFDLRRDPPIALEPGDGVRFVRIDEATYHELENEVAAGHPVIEVIPA